MAMLIYLMIFDIIFLNIKDSPNDKRTLSTLSKSPVEYLLIFYLILFLEILRQRKKQISFSLFASNFFNRGFLQSIHNKFTEFLIKLNCKIVLIFLTINKSLDNSNPQKLLAFCMNKRKKIFNILTKCRSLIRISAF